ncbi:MAG: SoxR reducing system RseC family protein [Bacteroidales bacterium]|nr:SoxR reducing system RseC family protein [Bacteroidales bacterium]
MSQIATHDGKVISVSPDIVKVEMHVLSACSSCKAHEKCAFVDKADKIVEVETPEWNKYNVGDDVIVSVDEGLGMRAVLLAYLVPAIILVAALVTMSVLTESQALAALVPIALVATYFLVLYRLRDRLQRKFTFGLTKAGNENEIMQK